MREVRADGPVSSPPPTPSRAHLRRVSDGGPARHLDYGDDRGNLSGDEMGSKRNSKSQWYVLLDPHELEGVRASALNTSPSRVHHPGGAQFAQEGVATLARTASLDSAAVGAQVALIYQTLRTGKTT
ncbi:uncharacterized protein [Amphiura filiformis]|uniref:uncharacterized protein isoform X2 n=1 Tax=Amphiura filiformis TaxID=82378 RepID=UPI003B2268EF